MKKLTNLNGIEITISQTTEQFGLSTLWNLSQNPELSKNQSVVLQDAFHVLSCVLSGTVEEKPEPELLAYAIIETLNGNYVLKELSKVQETDSVETELYGETIEEIQALFRAHKKDLKKHIRKDNNNMKQIINRLSRTTLKNLKNKHPKSFKGVTLKDINLFITCYKNFNYEPMQITKLYLKKSVAYCILLEYFTAERRL